MGLKEINETPGDINTGFMDINQKLRKQKDVQGQELWEPKEVQGNNKAMKIASNFTRILSNENVSPNSKPGRPNKRLHFALVFKGPKLGPQNQPFKDNPINHWKPQPKWSRLGVPFWSHAAHASSCVSLGHSNSTNDKNKPQMFSSHMHMVRANVTQHGHPMANLLLPQAICFDSLQLVLDNKAVTTPCEPSHEQFN